MEIATKCSRCGGPFIAGQSISGHENGTWHSSCPQPKPNTMDDLRDEIHAKTGEWINKNVDSRLGFVNWTNGHNRLTDFVVAEITAKLKEVDTEARIKALRQEHFARAISGGGGTTSQCECGKVFSTTAELQGHIRWNLDRLASLKGGDV